MRSPQPSAAPRPARSSSSPPKAPAPQRTATFGCLLRNLSDPRLGGALPVLTPSVGPDGPFALDLASFGCCAGTGRRLLDDAEITVSCDLGKRLASLRRLAWQFHTTVAVDGRTLEQELALSPPDAVQATLRRLQELSQGRTVRGLAWRHAPHTPRTPSAWVLAFTAAWRFGMEPHVVSLERTPVKQLVPPHPVLQKGQKPRPAVIIVENVHKLWDAQTADQLETVLAHAYNALTPLFVELNFIEVEPEAAADTRPGASAFNTRFSLSRRIAQRKSKSPLEWLRPDAFSKLAAACDGLKDPRPKAAVSPARPSPPTKR